MDCACRLVVVVWFGAVVVVVAVGAVVVQIGGAVQIGMFAVVGGIVGAVVVVCMWNLVLC